ncbi:MAG: NfeD family protein [Ruminococcus sp.]|nr:NfeD family protein [Ruminococcus sp.]
MNVLLWAAAVIVFVILEIITVQLVSVWLAAGAFITMIAAYFTDIGLTGQFAVFAVSSAILLAVSFPLMKKSRKKGYIPTNSELNTGKQAVVIEEINTRSGTGRVTLSGVDWKAVSDEIIPVDSIVTVKAVDGAKLIVIPEVIL